MMRTLMQILLKEFRQLVRTPALVFILALCPVVTVGIVPFGLSNKPRVRVDVVDESFSGRGREAVSALAGSPQIVRVFQSPSLPSSEERMDLGKTDAILVVPRDGEAFQLIVDASQTILGRDAAYYVSRQLSSGKTDPSVRVHTLFVSGVGNTHYYLVTMLVLMIAIIGCCLSALSVVNEKESKALEHLRSTGLSATMYLFSKLLFFCLVGLVELSFGLLIARVLFGLTSAGSLWNLYLLAVCFLFVIVNLGILIATGTRTLVRAIYVLVFVFITLILLSTMFAPLDNMDPAWAATRFVNPFFWMVDGSWRVLLKGFSFSAVAGHCLALTGLGGLLAVINIRNIKQVD
ncbi:MAG: ABC transporter permease [Bacteroidales bacterium]|nr:ABC transporter permease [Bacteroidales bacterium]